MLSRLNKSKLLKLRQPFVATNTFRKFSAKASLPVLPHFDYTPIKYEGPSYEQVLKMRRQHVAPASFTFYKEPILAVEGKMQYIFDHTGKRYLDLFGGVSTVGTGHCHPRVMAKMKEQMGKLQHTTTIYLND